MKHPVAFAVAALVALSGAALSSSALAADDGATQAPAATQPWQAAAAILAATQADFNSQGIRGVESHVGDLEKMLAGAKDAILATRPATGDIYVLTDGTADVLVGMTAAALAAKQAGTNRNAVAVSDPYPLIALYLGSYYDEIGRPGDAARVLDAGLAVYDMDGYISPLGEHKSWLLLERGAAANSQKDFATSLAITDKGLALSDLPPQIRAHFYRNRGFALTELGRLDESEQAYRQSLEFDPGNTTAQNELAYIAKLKAGADRQPGGLKPLSPPDAAKKPDI